MPVSESGSEERLRSLIGVSRRLGTIRETEELIRALAREMEGLVPFDHLSLHLGDAVEGRPAAYVLEAGKQSVVAPGVASDEIRAIAADVVRRQQPLSMPLPPDEPGLAGVGTRLADAGFASLCAVPLTTSVGPLGAMIVASRTSGAYPRDVLEFLSLLAEGFAIVLDGAANIERLRSAKRDLERSHERLELVQEVGRSILSILDLETLLRSISAHVRRALRCDAVSVLLVSRDAREARIFVLDFPGGENLLEEGFTGPVVGSPLEDVIRTGRPAALPAPPAAFDMAGGYAHPLVSRGRTLGVLIVGRRENVAFGGDDLELLAQIASQVATALDNALAYQEIAELNDKLAREKLYLEGEIRSELDFEQIIGRSGALRRVLRQVETVAATDSTVLIEGETGSGKELVARAIHDLGARRERTFVKLNCAAIPTGLLESELFGHKKGAFTGAIADRVGRFELANGGTMFLDEVGEVPLEIQPKLLRVLQEREFERIGSSHTMRTDARLIAATNRDLGAMVAERTFRADLFYRLNVFPIRVPPLRERREDIPLLVRHFVEQLGRRMNRKVESIPAETMTTLERYDWPGNIRELQNLIERALIVSTGPVLRVLLDDLKPGAAGDAPAGARSLADAERAHILQALEASGWVVGGPRGAAVRLGLNRSTLQFRMQKLGIERPAR